MATTITSLEAGSVSSGIKTASPNFFWDDLENSRFGYMPMILLAIAILGGMAASFALHMNLWALLLVVLPTVICFCLMLAVMPMRIVISTAALAICVDLILITIGTFIK